MCKPQAQLSALKILHRFALDPKVHGHLLQYGATEPLIECLEVLSLSRSLSLSLALSRSLSLSLSPRRSRTQCLSRQTVWKREALLPRVRVHGLQQREGRTSFHLAPARRVSRPRGTGSVGAGHGVSRR